MFQTHRAHLNQLPNHLGYSHGKVTSIYSLMAVVQGFAAIWMINNFGENRPLIYIPFFVLQLGYAELVIRTAKKRDHLIPKPISFKY